MSETPALDPQDRLDILETLHFLSHVIDNREWDHLADTVTEDVEYLAPRMVTPVSVADLAPAMTLHGPAGIRQGYELSQLARYGSVHVLNTVIEPIDGDTAVTWSRMILVSFDQRAVGTDAVDTVVRTPDGWRITRRVIHARNMLREPEHSGAGYVPGPYTFMHFNEAIVRAQETTANTAHPSREEQTR
ncbi:nuclear transport factor 2 family protein [Kocuria sp. cx-455]|uniref:nuclear transport factor 2 family protein n=1 Tax=unclassified Candidatus Sulfotelmatobacter TaxID=2635724 RepID=UPI00168A05F9|nr:MULTISPECIES: nuclear transport factor 2 family protein [unclassified Candidatus Sulfotelmatobacter]MBD2761708.1 nuclear transport factor 2 family protein [Kocuria sp. cx-116]MBD2764019.1 nuclear transport factor 2 family protein [Kocuria sp. cx-455]